MVNAENTILLLVLLTLLLTWFFTLPRPFFPFIKNYFSLRTVFIYALLILLFLQSLEIISAPLPDNQSGNIFTAVGILVCICAATFAISAKLTMKQNWGLPGKHQIKRQEKLVTSGPFSVSRNPIYVGLFFFFFGFQMTLRSYFLILVIPLGFSIYKNVIKEEILLEKFFGKEYLVYKKKGSPLFFIFIVFLFL